MLLFILACTASDPSGGGGSTTTSDGGATSDGGSTGDGGTTWHSLAGTCEAPDGLGAPAVQQLGEVQDTQTAGDWFMELVDIEVGPDGSVVYGAGQGGVMAFDVTDPTDPVFTDFFPDADGVGGRFYHVEPGPQDLLYATHRNQGLAILDASDPFQLEEVGLLGGMNQEGLVWTGDHLVVVGLSGQLQVFSLADPRDPQLVGTAEGLGSAWDLVIEGTVGQDAVAWVASSTLGVVPVDLSEAGAPQVGTAVAVGGGVQDVARHGDHLYAAAGGAGIVTLDLAEPLSPVVLDTLDLAGSVQSVAVDDSTGLLWAVDQQDVLAFDLSDGAAPSPVGTVQTPEHAMHVAAAGGLAFVGDWSRFGTWKADPTAMAPDLDTNVGELLVRDDATTLELTVRNTGGGELSLVGLSVGDERFTAEVSATVLAPTEEATVRLSFAGGTDVDTTLCIASNDPDTPTFEVALSSGGEGNDLFGIEAPDFALTDLDGDTHVLSEQLGHPVLLAYFATW